MGFSDLEKTMMGFSDLKKTERQIACQKSTGKGIMRGATKFQVGMSVYGEKGVANIDG